MLFEYFEREMKVKSGEKEVDWRKIALTFPLVQCKSENELFLPEVKFLPPGYGFLIFKAFEITLEVEKAGPWIVIQFDPSTVILISPQGVDIPLKIIMRKSNQLPFSAIKCRVSFKEEKILVLEE